MIDPNLIASAMYAQCDPDGNQYVLLDSLVDHRCFDMVIQPADQKVVRPDGRTYMKRNTIGWQICCQWKDGSTSWENLSDLKESHPLETAEYAVTIGIQIRWSYGSRQLAVAGRWWGGGKHSHPLNSHRQGGAQGADKCTHQDG